MVELLIREELIFDEMEGSFSDIVECVSKELLALEIVKDSYPVAIIQREQEYPTGLAGKHGGFAIPHTYCQHCQKSALAIIRTRELIAFTRMDDHSASVECGLIIMLAIANPKEQLPVLRKLMKALQDKETFDILSNEKNKAVVVETLQQLCLEEK